mmetsp:Transcript_8514/g.14344  ORF Transcript_8514/g.14344 Transcript_8514/m.14344 type:complete len:136 (-) Transcript_8514:281-688(-)
MLSRVCVQARGFASKLMAGSTNNKSDSAGRRLGIKKWGDAEVRKGQIIARQRGQHWHPGQNAYRSKDFTIHAGIEGKIAWSKDRYSLRKRSRINVVPQEIPNRMVIPPPPFVFHPELFPEKAATNPAPANLFVRK